MSTRTAVPKPTERDLARFRSKVVPLETGCHGWSGGSYTKGYALFTIDGNNYRAHRVIYVWTYGEPNCDIHHSCGNRWCVNPEHLYPASAGQPRHRNANPNLCARGHEFSIENTVINSRGERQCRACLNDAAARYRESNRAAINAKKRAARALIVREPKPCKLCGTLFTPKHRDAMYCQERACVNERQRLNRLGRLGRG